MRTEPCHLCVVGGNRIARKQNCESRPSWYDLYKIILTWGIITAGERHLPTLALRASRLVSGYETCDTANEYSACLRVLLEFVLFSLLLLQINVGKTIDCSLTPTSNVIIRDIGNQKWWRGDFNQHYIGPEISGCGIPLWRTFGKFIKEAAGFVLAGPDARSGYDSERKRTRAHDDRITS